MTTFYNLVDQKLNWGVSFNYNPLYLFFNQVESGREITYLPLGYLIFCQVFFLIPLLVLLFLKFRFSLPFFIGAFSAIFFTLLVTDFFFWSLFHSLPLVFLILRALKRTTKYKIPLAVLASILWAWTGGAFAFVGSLGLLWMVKDEGDRTKLAFLIPALIFSILFLPEFPLPNFPGGARLAEISEATFWPDVFFGPNLRPNPIDYPEYSSRMAGYIPTAVTNTLLALALLFQIRNREVELSAELNLILFISVFLLVESLSAGAITQSLSTMMYGLSLLPFSWLLTCLGVLVSFGAFLISPSNKNLPFNLGFTILCLFYLSNLVTNFDGVVIEPRPIGTLFSDRITTDLSMVTPLDANFASLHAAEVSASVNPGEAKAIVDRRAKTLWSSASPMKGDEVVEIKLETTIDCSIISISPGSAKSDFPRGIKVEVSEDRATYRLAALFNNWNGPIRSMPDGLLYYGPQGEVELNLKSAKQIRSLKISQTGRDSVYSWSIAEVRCAE